MQNTSHPPLDAGRAAGHVIPKVAPSLTAAVAVIALSLGAAPGAAQDAPKPPATVPATAAKPAEAALAATLTVAALRADVAAKSDAWTILDVRPAWQFAEFHVPGAVSVKPSDAAAKVASLPAGSKVVIVDRDGTTAFAVAALARPADGSRSVVVLSGGTLAWWRETNDGSSGAAAPKPRTPEAPAPSAPKRPAGC